MPHIWIEYSANLDLDTRALMRVVQDAAVGDGSLYPLAGARTRALRVDDYLIVDGHPDNAFVHVLLRIGHGRSSALRPWPMRSSTCTKALSGWPSTIR